MSIFRLVKQKKIIQIGSVELDLWAIFFSKPNSTIGLVFTITYVLFYKDVLIYLFIYFQTAQILF
jgi:hypothetical protein